MKTKSIFVSLVCVSLLFHVDRAWAAPPPEKHALVWDAMTKTVYAKPGETIANYSFWVTNTSKFTVLITEVIPDCGCTVVEYPKPWALPPGGSGELKASMNFAGQQGMKQKGMKVVSSGGPRQELLLKVMIPFDDNEERRKANMAAAAKNRQVVFQGECASCHVEPLQGKLGKDLFDAGCNICHEPHTGHRAEIVPDLKMLPFQTDKDYWRRIIADGKEGSLMPGFAKKHGGPLTDEEIESLVEYAVKAFPGTPSKSGQTN